MTLLKRFFFLATAIHITLAVKPPNYIEKPKVPDKYPPKYEFNYFIANRQTHASQGHKEIRNGDYTRGNYFVNLPKGEGKTTVNYIADEWGFFPVTRYSNRGPHHRVSGHFALGQHAVERLNETNLNTNEVYINQLPDYAPHQQQAQATFPAPQVYNPKTSLQVPLIDNKPLGSSYAPNQPHHDHHQQQQIIFQPPGVQFNQLRNPEKHSTPLIYQHAPQMPLLYQFAHQNTPSPQINYYQNQPQEVIYHQQPIASMGALEQQHQQPNYHPQQQFVFVDESQQLLPAANGNINVEVPQEEIISPQIRDGVNGNLIQVQPEAANNVASENQKQAMLEKDIVAQSQETQFESPIVVGDQQISFLPTAENETVVVQPNQGPLTFESYQPPHKQFNLQILTDTNASDQNLKESSVAPKIVNGHTNSNNFQYLVDDDQDLLDSTPSARTEAPSRQFLKKFKNFRTYEESTTATSFSTSTSRTITKVTNDGGCCKDKAASCCKNQEVKVLEITQRPVPNSILAPVHAGVRLTNDNAEDCVDEKPVVEVHKNVNVVIEEQSRTPAYGERIVVSSTPSTTVVTQPIFIELPPKKEIVHQPIFIEKPRQKEIIHQPIFIEKPWQKEVIHQPIIVEKQHHTEVVHPPIVIEKTVIKEVQVPVEKQVFIKTPPKFIDRPVYIKTPPETKTVYVKSPPETKIVEKVVHQPFEVEKVVEKFIDRPYFIKSPPETKVVQQQVFVEKPVIKEVPVTVEKIQTVEKPVFIEKIIDRPVERIVEKEKPIYIDRIVQQPYEVERIVEKETPVIQTVEKIVPVETFIDRPYPVPYAVGVPFDRHVFLKPDFHVVAKQTPHKHKLFDFDALFGFLGKKKEVKHIYVPSTHQHQLKQLGHHQLISSSLTANYPVQESPVLDYSRYATTHLNPIKPVYGVPSTPLIPSAGYNYPNPYAGNYAYDQLNAASVGSASAVWANDNFEPQQQQQQHQNAPQPVAAYHHDPYVGPTPLSDDYWAVNGVSSKEGIKFRRNVENGRSFRIEYGGFLPKMSPSLEIDENGKPLKKEAN